MAKEVENERLAWMVDQISLIHDEIVYAYQQLIDPTAKAGSFAMWCELERRSAKDPNIKNVCNQLRVEMLRKWGRVK